MGGWVDGGGEGRYVVRVGGRRLLSGEQSSAIAEGMMWHHAPAVGPEPTTERPKALRSID